MRKNPIYQLMLVFTLLGIMLAACMPGISEVEQASTYAAQTLTAMPTKTATLEPTPSATPTEEPTPTPEPTLGPVGPVDFPEGVNPLTGMKVADPALLERRPVFVKVANYPPSGRPHAGLSAADLVFEYYIGYGSNRFMAVYYGQDTDKIGPVRSGRLVDPKLVNLYQGILGFQSAYETILAKIVDVLGNRAINGAGNICPAICDDGRNIVISVFADSAALTSLASQRGVDQQRFDLPGMAFDPAAPDGGQPGNQALVIYSNLDRGEWRYDKASGTYLRWIEDTTSGDLKMIPLTDANTDEQLGFSNVAILFAYTTEITPSLHDTEIWGNTSGQRAIIFRDGQAYDVKWIVPRNDQPIQFIDQNGDPFPLKPGNTWNVLLGVYSDAQQSEGNWTFNFYLP